MPLNKVDLSLDDIIKANKSKDNAKGKGGKPNKGLQGKRRSIGKPNAKNRIQKKKPGKPMVRANRGPIAKTNRTTTVATKRLVQKLVKKALAQTTVARPRQAIVPPRNSLRGKIRGGRILKKTVLVNRLKINPRSRMISRRRIIPQQVAVAVRRQPIQYIVQQQPVVRRVNYVQNARRQIRAPQRTIIVQERQPMNFRGRRNFRNAQPSIRNQISQMRQMNVPRMQFRQQVFRQQPAFRQQQQVRVIRQPQFVQNQRFQRGNQRRNNNFRGRPQQKFDPFYEPPNFLQRIL